MSFTMWLLLQFLRERKLRGQKTQSESSSNHPHHQWGWF